MDGPTALLVTLVIYKVLLLSIGAWASRRSRDGAEFYLGGRGLGPWVASISAAASSSSAWSLLGVSGAAFALLCLRVQPLSHGRAHSSQAQ